MGVYDYTYEELNMKENNPVRCKDLEFDKYAVPYVKPDKDAYLDKQAKALTDIFGIIIDREAK